MCVHCASFDMVASSYDLAPGQSGFLVGRRAGQGCGSGLPCMIPMLDWTCAAR